jgi:hypothetical protein
MTSQSYRTHLPASGMFHALRAELEEVDKSVEAERAALRYKLQEVCVTTECMLIAVYSRQYTCSSSCSHHHSLVVLTMTALTELALSLRARWHCKCSLYHALSSHSILAFAVVAAANSLIA